MIAEDIESLKQITNMISDGIVENYDLFEFEAYVYDAHIVRKLATFLNGHKNSAVAVNINGAVLSKYLRDLQQSARNRGEGWCGLVIRFPANGKVSVQFKYEYPEKQF